MNTNRLIISIPRWYRCPALSRINGVKRYAKKKWGSPDSSRRSYLLSSNEPGLRRAYELLLRTGEVEYKGYKIRMQIKVSLGEITAIHVTLFEKFVLGDGQEATCDPGSRIL
jgi:hypothetical protein